MNIHSHDILINGAGPVGSALALALGKKTDPSRIAIIGNIHDSAVTKHKQPPNNNSNTILPDPRTIALNHGSQVFLESIDAWPNNSAAISTVHVSQKGRLGRTLINNDDLDVARLGSVVNYDDLVNKLHQKIKQLGIEIISPNELNANQLNANEFSPNDINPNKTTPNKIISNHSEIMFQGDYTQYTNGEKTITSPIAIQSTGIKPKGFSVNYKQDAVLVNIQVSNPKPGWAFERFTKHGPLAVLPHPLGKDFYAVVWCCPHDMANDLITISDAQFNQQLQNYFGQRLGTLRVVGPRNKFALNLHVGANLINSRTIAIGNAAQTIHPVAGQGLNLGLRDVAQLSISLGPWLSNNSLDIKTILQSFTQKRSTDRWLTIGITNTLPQIFNTKVSLMEHICGISLATIDLIPPLRNLLTRNLLQGLRF